MSEPEVALGLLARTLGRGPAPLLRRSRRRAHPLHRHGPRDRARRGLRRARGEPPLARPDGRVRRGGPRPRSPAVLGVLDPAEPTAARHLELVRVDRIVSADATPDELVAAIVDLAPDRDRPERPAARVPRRRSGRAVREGPRPDRRRWTGGCGADRARDRARPRLLARWPVVGAGRRRRRRARSGDPPRTADRTEPPHRDRRCRVRAGRVERRAHDVAGWRGLPRPRWTPQRRIVVPAPHGGGARRRRDARERVRPRGGRYRVGARRRVVRRARPISRSGAPSSSRPICSSASAPELRSAWSGCSPGRSMPARSNPVAPLHLVVSRAPGDRFRRGEIVDEVTRTFPASSLTFVPADRRVEDASWEGELVASGPFVKAVASLAVAFGSNVSRSTTRSRRRQASTRRRTPARSERAVA